VYILQRCWKGFIINIPGSKANFNSVQVLSLIFQLYQTPKECLSRDPMFADWSDLLANDFITLVDSVESWTSKDHKDSALKLSFKVSTFPYLISE
jgi:hypothetical protein